MFSVDRSLPSPLPVQIAAGMRGLVSTGRLSAGDTVASTRELARQLGVSRGTVVSAYDQLLSEGFLLATQGAPTRIHPDLARAGSPGPAAHAPRPRGRAGRVVSLKPSSGHAGTIRPAAWRRAWREAAAEPAARVDKAGQPELRTAIASHLLLARGLAVDAGDVVVTGGSREGLLLILMSLGRSLRVGVEDPGHPGLRRVIPVAGHTPVTCRTDAGGLVVSDLPADLDALLVTPSHLYPLGGSMPASRRAELLDWAARTGCVLIEDDFNTELRYRVSPQPTLATLASEARVLTLGTFSTLLSTQLSAGYVVAGQAMAATLRGTREVLGMPVSPVTQRAIANLLDGGYVRRNTRAVHSRLARRREVLGDAICPALEALGANAIEKDASTGVDLAVRFPTPAAEERVVDWLAARGIECGKIGASESGGLIMSFAHLDDDDFERVRNEFSSVSTHRS